MSDTAASHAQWWNGDRCLLYDPLSPNTSRTRLWRHDATDNVSVAKLKKWRTKEGVALPGKVDEDDGDEEHDAKTGVGTRDGDQERHVARAECDGDCRGEGDDRAQRALDAVDKLPHATLCAPQTTHTRNDPL
jgi:hypothetical protein